MLIKKAFFVKLFAGASIARNGSDRKSNVHKVSGRTIIFFPTVQGGHLWPAWCSSSQFPMDKDKKKSANPFLKMDSLLEFKKGGIHK